MYRRHRHFAEGPAQFDWEWSVVVAVGNGCGYKACQKASLPVPLISSSHGKMRGHLLIFV